MTELKEATVTSAAEKRPGLRIAVTGSSGYIGSWLCQRLEIPENQRWSRDKGADFDVTQAKAMAALVRQSDVILHLAGISGIQKCEADSKSAYRANGTAAVELAKLAKEQGVKRFVLASTSAVYGQPAGNSITENTAVDPQGVYGKSKLMGEEVLKLVDNKFEVVVLRKTNVYGYGMVFKGRNAVDTILTKYLMHNAIELTGGGSQKRDFIHLMDVVNLYAKLATAPTVKSGIYNVGGPECLSIRELAESVNAVGEAVFGYRVPMDVKEEGAGVHWEDVLYDCSKARNEWHYDLQFKLDDYIKERMLLALRTRGS